MAVVCFGTFIILAVMELVIHKKYTSPNFVMLVLWAFICYLCSLNLYGINQVSDWVYGLTLIGILCFVFGSILRTNFKIEIKVRNRNQHGAVYKYVLRQTFVYLLMGLSLIMFLRVALHSLQLLSRGYTLEYIRNIYQSEAGETTGSLSTIENGIYSYICVPFLYAIIPYTAYNFIRKNISKWFLSVILVLITTYIIGCAGRMTIVYSLLSVIISYAIINGKSSSSVKQSITVIAVIFIAFTIFMTISGNRGVNDIQRSMYLYFCGAMPHFEYRANILNSNNIAFYGVSTLKGFLTPVFSLLNATHILPYPQWFSNMLQYVSLSDRVSIGTGVGINAFATCFYSFYSDFRWIGVVFGMLLYGYISQTIYEKACAKTDNEFIVSLYLLIIFGIASSMIRFQIVASNYAYALIFLRIIFRKEYRACEE